jgi:uncharacterized protein YaaW (UPF0174 family)
MASIQELERRLNNNDNQVAQLRTEIDKVRRMAEKSAMKSPMAKQNKGFFQKYSSWEYLEGSNSKLGKGTKRAADASTKIGGAFGVQIAAQLGGQAISSATEAFSTNSANQAALSNAGQFAKMGVGLAQAALIGGPVGLAVAAAAMAIDLAGKAYALGLKLEARMGQSIKDQQRLGVITTSYGRT